MNSELKSLVRRVAPITAPELARVLATESETRAYLKQNPEAAEKVIDTLIWYLQRAQLTLEIMERN